MELFLAIFEPLTESVVIGLLACWAVSYLWEFSAILFFIKHLVLWFFLDYLLLRIVQGVSFLLVVFLLFFKVMVGSLLAKPANHIRIKTCSSIQFPFQIPDT